MTDEVKNSELSSWAILHVGYDDYVLPPEAAMHIAKHLSEAEIYKAGYKEPMLILPPRRAPSIRIEMLSGRAYAVAKINGANHKGDDNE